MGICEYITFQEQIYSAKRSRRGRRIYQFPGADLLKGEEGLGEAGTGEVTSRMMLML